MRASEVLLENADLLAGEAAIEDVEVGLIVQTEGAIVEIRRSHRNKKAINDEYLAVYMVGWYS